MGIRRFVLTIGFRIVNALCHAVGWRTRSVHALVVTADNRLLLVRHSYAPKWCLPGGVLKRNETPLTAIVRELREEIGLTAWSHIAPLGPESAPEDMPGRSWFLIEGAEYCFRRNFEIDRVEEFDLEAPLPADQPLGQKRLLDHWLAERTRPGREGVRAAD